MMKHCRAPPSADVPNRPLHSTFTPLQVNILSHLDHATASWLCLPRVSVLLLLARSSSPHPRFFSPPQANLLLYSPENEHATFLLQTSQSLSLSLHKLSPDQVYETLLNPLLEHHLLFSPLPTLHPPCWFPAVPRILQACWGLSVFIIASPSPWTTLSSERSMVLPHLLSHTA